MDQKYLSEIKAREQAATPGPWVWNSIEGLMYNGKETVISSNESIEYDSVAVIAQNNAAFIAHARTDIPALISEVERLMAENEQNAAYAEIYQDICDKYGKNFRALLDKAKALQAENATLKNGIEAFGKINNTLTAQIATLKKALELACENISLHDTSAEPMLATELVNLFMKQAEQRTDEVTHGEANHDKET